MSKKEDTVENGGAVPPAAEEEGAESAAAEEEGAESAAPEDPLVALTRERDEYLDLAQRTRADFENFRRRSLAQAAEAEIRGKAALARELVPAVDSLERALQAAGVDPDGERDSSTEQPSEEVSAQEALAHGVALVYREVRIALARAGVHPYDPKGERFDPIWHEALSTLPADGIEPGIVVETLQKGYRLGDLALRPAKVVVSAAAPAPAEERAPDATQTAEG